MPFHFVDATGTRLGGVSAGATLVVGRSADCGVVLADPTVSRRHAELAAAADHVLVRDLGSRNGTFRNGMRVETARLRAGDVVTFGVVPLRVEHEAEADAWSATSGASALGPLVLGPVTGRSPLATPEVAGVAVVEDAPVPPPGARAAVASGSPPHASAPAPAAPPPRANGPSTAPTPEEDFPIVAERETPHELTTRRLGQLIDAAKALGGAAEVAVVHERIVAAALRTLEGDRGAIAAGAEAEALTPVVVRDRWGADLGAGDLAAIPRSITRAAFARRAAVLTADASADPRFVGQSVLYQRVRSALCAPLAAADGTLLGVLYVDSADPARRFDEADLDFLAAFAGLASAALENARLAERLRREAVARENFSRYFAPPVAERIAASETPARPGGERRTVAVLFADLRGFTRLASGLAPDDLAATLSDFLSAMVECVFRHGGTLDKFIGDCVMAQWGAPERTAEDADRALRAALDMLVALDVLNAGRRTAGRPVLGMGIGLAHGEVFAGNIGSERRLEFTVIGDVVNQASRLCDAAAAGELLVSDALRVALRGPAPHMRALIPPPSLPGYANPPAVWSLTLATAYAG